MYLYTQVRTRHLLDTKLRQQSARAEGICQVTILGWMVVSGHLAAVAFSYIFLYFCVRKHTNKS